MSHVARLGFALLAATLLFGSSIPWAAAASKSSDSQEAEKILRRERKAEVRRGEALVETALTLVGTPYVWGGTTPSGFDCSGFVAYVYGTVGLSLPHDQMGQLASGRSVDQEEMIPGDLLIFQNTYRGGPSHSGIYLGEGRFVHAANEAHGVTVSLVNDGYWGPRFYGASRPGR